MKNLIRVPAVETLTAISTATEIMTMTHDNNALAQQFEHWFFKYLADDQRKELFRLTCGQGVADEANNHSHQRIVLKRILSALRQPAPASGEVGELVKAAYCEGHQTGYCGASFDDVGQDWSESKAADMLERLAGSGEKPDTRRWNIEWDGNDLLICFDEHEKGEKCDYRRYCPAEAVQPTQQPGDLVEWVRDAILAAPTRNDTFASFIHLDEAESAARAAIAAMPSGEAGQVDVAPIWRNAITNTIALIDITRRKHKPKSKGHAAFDAELNDLLDKWYSFSRGVSPETYVQAESEWQRFKSIAMPLPTPPAQGEG